MRHTKVKEQMRIEKAFLTIKFYFNVLSVQLNQKIFSGLFSQLKGQQFLKLMLSAFTFVGIFYGDNQPIVELGCPISTEVKFQIYKMYVTFIGVSRRSFGF